MTQKEFLQRLAAELAPLSDTERARVMDYYNEMICDGMENGKSEQEMVDGFGQPQDVAAQILAESRCAPASGEDGSGTGTGASAGPDVYTARGIVKKIDISARHTAVELRRVDSGPVKVHFRPCENDRVAVDERNGTFTFRHTVQISIFHWKALLCGPRTIVVDVPASFEGEISVVTCNARLEASGIKDLAKARFVTSNARLTLRDIDCGDLGAETSNGAAELYNLRGERCEARTSNAHITADGCEFAGAVRLHTGNGAIRCRDLVSDKIELRTENASVVATVVGDMREYAVHSHTSNASNTLPPELSYPEQSKSIDVSTSNAKIDVHFIQRRD